MWLATTWWTILYCNEKMIFKFEFTRFIFVGLINTFTGLIFIYALVFIGVNGYLSNLIGYIIGLVVSFILNRYFTFQIKTRDNIYNHFTSFLVVFLISYLVNIITLYFSLKFFSIYVAQLFAIGTYSMVNYLLNKYITFKEK